MLSMKAKKQAASEALKAERSQCEEKFDADVARAQGLPDPAATVLQLERIRQVAHNAKEETHKIRETVKKLYPMGKKQEAIYWGLALPTLAVGSVTYLVQHLKRRDAFEDHLMNEARDHFNRMSEKITSLNEMVDVFVAEHMQEIIESPLRAGVLAEPNLLARLVDKHVPVIAKSPLCKDIQDEPALLRNFAEVALRKGLSFEEAEEKPVATKEKFVPTWQKLADYNVIVPRGPK